MKRKVIFTTLLAIFAFNFFAIAQTPSPSVPKIGYTNLDYILSQLPEAKQIESELQAYEKQLQNQLQSKYGEYEKKLQDYEKSAKSGVMTDVVREDKEKELMNMQKSIREFEENAQSSLQKKQVSLLEPVLEKVQKAIDQVGEENGYSFILSTHADYGGSAIILYAKNKEDNISDLVLKKLGVTPQASTDTKSNTSTNTSTPTNAEPKPANTQQSGAPKKK
ncbi:MAG: OmpH family outer membrane protein [Cytophagaceae bacterium]